jgi:hypothetical protein
MIPEPIDIRNALDDAKTGERMTFAQSFRLILALAAHAGVLDALTLIEVRDHFTGDRGSAGRWVVIGADEYEAITPFFRRPKGLAPSWVLSAESHVKAWLDAKDTKPAILAEPANGAKVEA